MAKVVDQCKAHIDEDDDDDNDATTQKILIL